jgi:Domain of unknown function (DUF4388)
VRLEGSLDAFGLPDIFSLLSMTKKTGGLHLRRADAHGVVWLGDGLITGGASDSSRLPLGHRLAGCPDISHEALTTAVDAVSRTSGLGIASALRAAKAIGETELQAIVSEQIIDSVFDLMRWPDGVFQFVGDEANIDDVGVSLEVEAVVTEARRRLETWASFDEAVTTSSAVLSLALEPGGELRVSGEEWSLLALVDGRRTVGDLVSTYGRGEYCVVVALADLVGRGLIRANEGEDFGVTALIRRQDLVATLEVEPTATSEAVESSAVIDAVVSDDGDDETVGDSELDAAVTEGAEADADDDDDDEKIDEDESQGEPIERHTGLRSVDPPMTLADYDSAGEYDADIDFTADAASNGHHVVELTSVPRSALDDDDDEPEAVTPRRPEPFMPSREPEHPEPMAVAAGGGGASAMPSPLIERDPSVNKSLLLRLIAGVRGL